MSSQNHDSFYVLFCIAGVRKSFGTKYSIWPVTKLYQFTAIDSEMEVCRCYHASCNALRCSNASAQVIMEVN